MKQKKKLIFLNIYKSKKKILIFTIQFHKYHATYLKLELNVNDFLYQKHNYINNFYYLYNQNNYNY